MLLLAGLMLPACVSSKKYKLALREQAIQDSLRGARERDIRHLNDRVAQLGRDTARQGESLRDWQQKYRQLASQSASQTQQLSEQLATTSTELQARNRELQAKQQALETYSRELEAREAKVNELNAMVRRQDSVTQALLGKVQSALVSFGKDELTVNLKDGKVYVSLSEQLLFQSGSAEVNQKGRDALLKLAEVLNKNPDIEVQIEGHTDNVPIKTSVFKDNWDLSVLRATSVVRILTWAGKVDSRRVIPSGRSDQFPVAANDTREGRALNRRTEIILSPKLDELFSILQSK
jgi:chemotaxis protein MotB